MTGPALTLVTVVFEPETPLLELQARSLARFVPDGLFVEVLVVDNTRRGVPRHATERLRRAYGPAATRLRVLRPDEIAVVPAARGWTVQQVLKLLVHRHVTTSHYLVLDAKNHWIRGTSTADFLAPDGRARGASHSYRAHALRRDLDRVLRYLGVDPEPWLDDFPVTHTPIVLETEVVAELVRAVENRSGRDFASEFVDAGLTEFFLYAGWLIAAYGGIDGHLDGSVIRSANVWPSERTTSDVRRVLDDAQRLEAPFLSVHRTALARCGPASSRVLADFWLARGLLPDRRAAMTFIAGYKTRYLRTMTVRKIRTRLSSRHR